MKIYPLLCLFLITFSLTAQDFNKQWDEIIELEKSESIKSALMLVEQIEKQARKTKNEPQIIRAFFYKSKFLQRLDEDAQTKIIKNLKREIENATPPTQALLNYIYAVSLNEYLNDNRYKIRDRTPTEGENSDHFLQWSINQIENEIKLAIQKSISDPQTLKNTSIANYKEILDNYRTENIREESLYDFLIDKYIEFHKESLFLYSNNVTPFVEENKKKFFSDADVFTTIDSDSINLPSLKNTIKFYQLKEVYKPLPENQFERMKFMHSYVFKDVLAFIHTLDHFQKKLQDSVLIQKVQLEKARLYEKIANKKTNPEALLKAKKILDSILENNINYFTHKLALYQKQNILTRTISVSLNQYSYEEENTRAHISYKNVDSLHIKYYKVSAQFNFNYYGHKNDSIMALIDESQRPYFQQNLSLPATEDYFETSTQILLPKLPLGRYVVLFEADENSLQNNKAFSYTTVTITNLAVLHHQVMSKYPERDKVFQIIDRKKGTPVKDVNLHFNSKTLMTDENGIASFKMFYNQSDYTSHLLAHKNEDTLYLPLNRWTLDLNSKNYDEVDENKIASVRFYSDRGIYRPGQKVYIKGIAIKRQSGEISVVPGVTFNIEITGPNGDDVKDFDIRTNEYGSFDFEFEIPKNGLTGYYSISAEEGLEIENDEMYNKKTDEHPFWDHVDFEYSHFNFSVEEYKRPTFIVKMDAVTEAYALNDSVKFEGVAKAFSGANISNGKMVYRVERQAHTRFGYGMSTSSELISEGETTTDADGKITVIFKALPDESFKKENLPVFNYTVYVDVTDLNGETQSGQQSIRLGYHSLLLEAKVDEELYLDPSKKIMLSSTNLNGEFIPVEGELQIYFQKILQPEFIEPLFPVAEKPLISEEEFKYLFPYEKKAGAEIPEENGERILTKDINTEVQKEVDLDFLSQQPEGHYRIVFSAYDKDEEIKTVSEFRLLDKNKPAPDELFTVTQNNPNPYEDKQLRLEIKSQIPDLFVNIQGLDVKKNSLFYENHTNLKNGSLSLKIPIDKHTPEDIVFQVEAFFENHFFHKEIRIIKPEITNLDIEVISMRNKLEPGSNETWSFKIARENKSAEAEVLTSMYDQSLDEFSVIDWEKPLLPKNYYYYSDADQKNISTEKNTFNLKNLNSYIYKSSYSVPKTDIQWFGFSFGSVNNYAKRHSYERWVANLQKTPEKANTTYGYVKDDTGLPLPGVNIVVKGTQRGTQTDFDGYFEIDLLNGEELVFSYVGFATQEIIVNSGLSSINVQMQPGDELSQVVVTGYAVKRDKKALGYAVAEADIVRNLAGKSAGVVISNASGISGDATQINIRGYLSIDGTNKPLLIIDGVVQEDYNPDNINLSGVSPGDIESIEELKGFEAAKIYGSRGKNGVLIITTKKGLEELMQVQTRKNFQETAFFYPDLRTNKKGEIQFDFTTPEALTTWKFRLLAHNKKGQSAYLERTTVTQKDLMVTPNMPRFFREMDTITITARISNITSESKSGTALLQLFNAVDMKQMEAGVILSKNTQEFHTEPKGNTTVSWLITIPKGIQGVQYKVVAKSGNFTDGEENILPVLTNTLLVTESISMWVRENSKKEFTLQNLKNNNSTTLRNHKLTFEYTANPVWLAIEALPYLLEFEHNCSEQIFARYYANKLAIKILNDNPEIAQVYEKWKSEAKPLSKLAQNEELKNILLAETPWLLDSESEAERNNRVALLFDLDKMSQNSDVLIDKLVQMQGPSGGFPWFQGGYENTNITHHILSGMAKLENQNIELPESAQNLTSNGISFADFNFLERHTRRENSQLGFIFTNAGTEIDYLYCRSFYTEKLPLSERLASTADIYIKHIISEWRDLDLQRKAKAALILHRFGYSVEAKTIINGLRETSALNEEFGMYWISNKPGWLWFQSPIENQALLINAFDEIEKDTASVEKMKIWLLKNKQTKNWPTTKATTEAVYALLNFGKNHLKVNPDFNFQIGKDKYSLSDSKKFNPTAGSGYIKMTYSEEEITKDKADIIIENNSELTGFGGVYWQYFEELDKIKSAPESLFQIKKELFIKKNTPRGQQLQKITPSNKLQIGDILTVKVTIETKENVEYVHLKDMRASGLEPVQVISSYQSKDGLGYYQSTRDAATHFFFDKIDKGTYIIEYDLRVNNAGNYSNGITTIQSMYAPEFSHHTAGMRLEAE